MAAILPLDLRDLLLARARHALGAGRGAADPQRMCREVLGEIFRDLAEEARQGRLGQQAWGELADLYAPLLDLRPAVADGALVLGTSALGGERKESGSYYTPAPLVSAILDSTLEPLIIRACAEADPAAALLALAVVDPACGSGQFLVAAARRLATALARAARLPYREALREIVGNCLFGLDHDPTAALICRVSLWLEARDFALPLERRIRVGNGLMGATPALVAAGLPDAAFTPIEGDDPQVCRALRQANRQAAPGPIDGWNGAVADAWCAAFVWRKRRDAPAAPTDATLRALSRGEGIARDTAREIARLAAEFGFCHGHLAFPEVRGGFAAAIGNPPWERVKVQDKEWFGVRHAAIAGARNAAHRARAIAALADTAPELLAAFRAACRIAAAESHFARHSGRFPLCGKGDVNTYALFAEAFRDLIGPEGRAGFIVPSGIATDHHTRDFFGALLRDGSLVSLFDFENRKGLFPEVDRRVKFALVTLTGQARPAAQAEFAFFAHSVADLADAGRRLTLTNDDLALLNPNSGTCPIFRSAREAGLVRTLYERAGVFVREGVPGGNPWGASFCRMFDMAGDSGRFESESGAARLPLYEAKLLHQFDHRWATFAGGRLRPVTPDEKVGAGRAIAPRYWVGREAVRERLGAEPGWLFAFRDIARNTDERTAIAAILPLAAVSHHAPLLLAERPPAEQACLLANFNSLALDFAARTKVGGTHLTFFIVKQLPLLPPGAYEPPLRDWIAERVVELTCTTPDLLPFGRACGYRGTPFAWDPERRFRLRCELDAAFFRLYGVPRDEIPFILATFPILERKDRARSGYYRTQEAILASFDRMQ
ncbi:MAG: N-6 DNA methylase [Candidatus Sericytochromatia bacterium]|nr:N-6 DNA methylase [Candidatus Tanganyikabacteria bacterium]